MRYLVGFLILLSALYGQDNNFVTIRLNGQLGNQLFQIATAYAYSLDHQLPLIIPDLVHKKDKDVPHNAKKLFLHKIAHYDLPADPSYRWVEPNFNYQPIPFCNRIELQGFVSSEKYFKHRRKEILELFDFPEGMRDKILKKYPVLATDELVVGIQIRDYRKEHPKGKYHPTIKRAYYERAIAQFPKGTTFIVSSNNRKFARECTEGLCDNIIYLNEPDWIEEFYTLVLCKSFIISNSTFGWWASWLSTAENKKTIVPNPWFALPYDNASMIKDLLPPECIVLNAIPK